MHVSYSHKTFNSVDYYPLSNGYADVFLHKNERTEIDEEGNTQYIAEEVYFQVDQSVTKEQIEQNFDYMWGDAESSSIEPTLEERLQALESAMLEIVLGGESS